MADENFFLNENPFAVLGVSPRHNREQIIEAEEEVSLFSSSEKAATARSILISPKNRIFAELSWLPGVSPRRAKELLDKLNADPSSIENEENIPELAKINLIAGGISQGLHCDDSESFFLVLDNLTFLVDGLNISLLMQEINEDRAVAKFPLITDQDTFLEIIDLRKKNIVDIIRNAFDKMPSNEIVDAMTSYAETWTLSGQSIESNFSELIIDGYETQFHSFLVNEESVISNLIEQAKTLTDQSTQQLQKILAKIDAAVRSWDRIAQPAQLLAQARGINHEISLNLGYKLRSLAIDLNNKYGKIDDSIRLSRLLSEVFSEIPELAEQVDTDLSTLKDLKESNLATEAERKNRLLALEYKTEIGLIFKETFELTSERIRYGGKSFRLDEITRIRWGSVSHSVNGIPTGTDYTIAFGSSTDEAVVTTRKKSINEAITDRLWKAVGIDILLKIIEKLKEGKILNFSNANLSIADEYVTLPKRGLFSGNEKKQFLWSDVTVSSYDGNFVIAAKNESKFYSGLSYIQTPNTHVFETLIRANFKNSNARKLSDTFKN